MKRVHTVHCIQNDDQSFDADSALQLAAGDCRPRRSTRDDRWAGEPESETLRPLLVSRPTLHFQLRRSFFDGWRVVRGYVHKFMLRW
jgi:hypothetical protein